MSGFSGAPLGLNGNLIPLGVSIGISAAQALLSPFFAKFSVIGGIIPDVTIEERHTDELVVTENPVEQDAAVADHAYKRPVSVMIRAGWSNSSQQSLGNPIYIQTIYQLLLALQASRVPFVIITTKRTYLNMLITRLQTDTDRRTANSMIVTAECREVIITTTQTVTVPPAANQANPQLTGATQNQGAQALKPAPNFNASAASQ